MRERIVAGVLAFGVAASAVLAAPTMAQDKLAASVGYYPGALISMPVLVAHEQKFFERNGLAVELVPVASGPAMTSAVASGSVTFVNNSWDNLILAVDKGLPVRAVAGSTVKVPFALLVRKGIALPHLAEGYPGIIKDLVGKNWGVLALGVSAFVFDYVPGGVSMVTQSGGFGFSGRGGANTGTVGPFSGQNFPSSFLRTAATSGSSTFGSGRAPSLARSTSRCTAKLGVVSLDGLRFGSSSRTAAFSPFGPSASRRMNSPEMFTFSRCQPLPRGEPSW